MTSLPPCKTSKGRTRTLALATLSALLMTLLGTSLRSAEADPHRLLRDFYPSGKYILYVSGELDTGARICHSQRGAAYLILDSAYGRPFLIQPRTRSVDVVPEDGIIENTNGTVDIDASVELSSLGRFQLQGTDVVMGFPELRARLKPNPPLTGDADAADILKHSPEHGRDPYRISEAQVAQLKNVSSDVLVRVFFGSWCPTCQRYLPRVIKLDQALAESNVKFSYYGLPKPPAAWQEPEYVRAGIQRLPTAVVTVNGRTIGQITGNQWNNPERSLALLLR
ncbi:MAG: thioredoxin domain-containing protein [Planctomycetota bacterium]|jgi:thiol-disulfide isomerase/thioredoxin